METLVPRDIPAPSSDYASTSNDDDSFHTNDQDDASGIEVPKWKEISLGSIYDQINPFTEKDKEKVRQWRKKCVDSDGKLLQMGIVGNRLFKQLHHMNSRTTPTPKLLYKKKERLQQRQLFMELDAQEEIFIRDYMVKNSRLASTVATIQADLSDDEDLTNPDGNKNVSRPDDSAIMDVPVPNWAEISLGEIYDHINPFSDTAKKIMRSWRNKCVDGEGKPLVAMGIIGNRLMKNLHQMNFMDTPNPTLLYLKKERLQQRQAFMNVSERGAQYIRTFLAMQIIELVDGVPVEKPPMNSFNIDEPIITESRNNEAPKNAPEQSQGTTNSSATLNHVLFESAAKDPNPKSSKEPSKKREWAQCQNTPTKQADVATVHVKDDDFSEATKGKQLAVMKYYESKMKLIRDSEMDDLDLIDLTADEDGISNEKVIEEMKRKKRIAFLQQRKEERKKVSNKLDYMFINDI